MSARATVLYDAPGPRGVRVNRILTAVTVVVAVAVLVENGGDRGQEATGGSVAAPIGRAVIDAAVKQAR